MPSPFRKTAVTSLNYTLVFFDSTLLNKEINLLQVLFWIFQNWNLWNSLWLYYSVTVGVFSWVHGFGAVRLSWSAVNSRRLDQTPFDSLLRVVTLSSRRMPIVLGTFTSSSTKFVDLSYHALLCVDAMKVPQRLVALNALGKNVKPQNEWWNVELSLRKRDLDWVINRYTARLEC